MQINDPKALEDAVNQMADHHTPAVSPKPPTKFPIGGFILVGLLGAMFYAVCGVSRDKMAENMEAARAAAAPQPEPAPPPTAPAVQSRPAPTSTGPDDVDIIMACRKMVKESLRSPDQSKFPGWLDPKPELATLRNGKKRWTDWVKVMNPYGVLLRQTVICVYDPKTDKLKMQIKDPGGDDE